MRRKAKRLACLALAFTLLLATILRENTPVQAAGDSSLGLYKWYQAKSIDDLKRYTDKNTGAITSYKGKWVPIIIVATYADGTSYYWNRNTRQGTWHSGESELVPQQMKPVTENDEIGLLLKNGMKSQKEFITKGDLGALHMYYHGEPTSYYEDGYVKAQTWSLTNDAVTDFSNEPAKTVYGIQNHKTYIALDQNNVETWRGTDNLPTTYSPRGDSGKRFEQGWTFYEDRYSGCFLIANMFGWAKNYKLKDGASGIYAPTIGCVLSGASRLSSPSKEHRNALEAPSRAAAVTYKSSVEGHVLSGEAARRAILEQYDYKYDDTNTRVRFKIFVGQPVAGGQTLKTTTVEDQTLTLGMGNTVLEDAVITVKKGATLIVPEDSFVYLEGTIVNEGTVIVEKGATVTTEQLDYKDQIGRIVCQNGGNLLVMERARVFLPNRLELNNASMVNAGLVVVNHAFVMEHAQVQMAKGSVLAVGFHVLQSRLFSQMDLGSNLCSGFIKNTSIWRSGTGFSAAVTCSCKVDGESAVVLEDSAACLVSKYTYLGQGSSLEQRLYGIKESGSNADIQKSYTSGSYKYQNQ